MSPTPASPRPYADPYVAGVALGVVLLAAFVVAGRGLGASGAFAAVAASATSAVAPQAAAGNGWIADHLAPGGPLGDWLVVEIVGVLLGAWLSARLAGRLGLRVERPSGVNVRQRLLVAGGGGALMGGAAVFARGCTSGQALTGGAMLSVGSWLFIASAFGAAYATSFLLKQGWR